jgi:Ca2+/Na+ antiporter
VALVNKQAEMLKSFGIKHQPREVYVARGRLASFFLWKHWERLSHIVTTLSLCLVVIGLFFTYRQYKSSESQEAENKAQELRNATHQAYGELDERYHDFLQLCIDHPELDCYDVVPDGGTQGLGVLPLDSGARLATQQRILYADLTSMFERAYLQYQHFDGSRLTELKANQWSGWERYILSFAGRPAYCDVWNEIRSEFDERFQRYMFSAAQSQCRQLALPAPVDASISQQHD